MIPAPPVCVCVGIACACMYESRTAHVFVVLLVHVVGTSTFCSHSCVCAHLHVGVNGAGMEKEGFGGSFCSREISFTGLKRMARAPGCAWPLPQLQDLMRLRGARIPWRQTAFSRGNHPWVSGDPCSSRSICRTFSRNPQRTSNACDACHLHNVCNKNITFRLWDIACIWLYVYIHTCSVWCCMQHYKLCMRNYQNL